MTERAPPGARVWALLSPLATLVLVAGALTALAGWRGGAVLIVAGFALSLTFSLGVGIWAYRHVMRRPWPKVPPLEDDDDW